MLNKKQAADYLGMRPYMIDKFTHKGDLAWYDFYGRRMYKEEDLDACREKFRKKKTVEVYPGVAYVPGMKVV